MGRPSSVKLRSAIGRDAAVRSSSGKRGRATACMLAFEGLYKTCAATIRMERLNLEFEEDVGGILRWHLLKFKTDSGKYTKI